MRDLAAAARVEPVAHLVLHQVQRVLPRPRAHLPAVHAVARLVDLEGDAALRRARALWVVLRHEDVAFRSAVRHNGVDAASDRANADHVAALEARGNLD